MNISLLLVRVVITSYSIHYTKLYDKEYAIKKDLKGICDILVKEYETIIGVYNSLIEILGGAQNEIFVITSYSIHYTKLYDILGCALV